MRPLKECRAVAGRRLRGSSLLEAVVAAVLFLTVYAAVMELLPRLTVPDDDALLVAEADYRVGRVFDKYGSGVWPCGEYTETYDWGTVTGPDRTLPGLFGYAGGNDLGLYSRQP